MARAVRCAPVQGRLRDFVLDNLSDEIRAGAPLATSSASARPRTTRMFGSASAARPVPSRERPRRIKGRQAILAGKPASRGQLVGLGLLRDETPHLAHPFARVRSRQALGQPDQSGPSRARRPTGRRGDGKGRRDQRQFGAAHLALASGPQAGTALRMTQNPGATPNASSIQSLRGPKQRTPGVLTKCVFGLPSK